MEGKVTIWVKMEKEHLSLINKRSEEGDWGEWSKHLLPSFFPKQSMTLIKKQLGLAAADKTAEYDEICSLTNPTVKESPAEICADDCDSAAECIFRGRGIAEAKEYQVILPLTTLRTPRNLCPNCKNGEQVALVRFPHGGTLIPILTVNNKQGRRKTRDRKRFQRRGRDQQQSCGTPFRRRF